MTICRYFLQGTCRYGNRCRYEHVYPNQHAYGTNYSGNGGSYGSYRGNSAGGGSYGRNYGFAENYGGANPGGENERGGISVLRAKAAGGNIQQGNVLFGQTGSNVQGITQYAPSPGFFSQNVVNQKQLNPQESKELHQMIINEFSIWEQSGQWPLSCFAIGKGQSCFPGLVDYSPEEIRLFMYQARITGNFEECQQYVKELYHKSKLVREQYMTPNSQTLEILSRLSQGEKIEIPTPTSLFPTEKFNTTDNKYGQIPGGSNVEASAAIAPGVSPPSSFTFTLPSSVPKSNTNQNIRGFGTSPMSMFPSTVFNGNIPNSGQSIFGNSSHNQSEPQSSALQCSDSLIYSPFVELGEELVNYFNAPVFTMGSVPIKPPPKELCILKR